MTHPSKYIAVFFLSVLAVSVSAQKKKKTVVTKPVQAAPVQVIKETPDTSAPKTVTITSAFKPSLKSAAKVNFIAATPVIDSSKIPVVYNIPSQNLFFSYKPVSLKPLALNIDSNIVWENDQYIKVGAGNFSSYLGEVGFSFGDGVNSITNLRGNFITTTGHLPAQQASKLGIDVLSIFKTGESHEWNAHAYYKSNTQYLYGYQPATLPYTKDDLLQRFNTVGIEVGVQNKLANPYGIKYNPQVGFIRFADNHDVSQNDLVIKLPLSKAFNKSYAFNLGFTADMTSSRVTLIPNPVDTKNDLYYVSPAFQLTIPNLKLNLGIQPSWSNKVFSALPEITAEAKLSEDLPISFEAGWIGYYHKNTYRSLSDINPFINSSTPLTVANTKINEQYVGIKGNSGSHFTYGARVSLLKFNDQALFVNNTGDGKAFNVVYEPDMKAIRLHGELGYTMGEKISVLASMNFTQYNGLSVNEKAWGLLPFETTGTLKWKLLKDLQLKADVFLWDGSFYKDRVTGLSGKLDPVADLNVGAEFTVLPRLNIWFQMNNMLNSAYQRWNQYPVLGFTVLGGVVYSFR